MYPAAGGERGSSSICNYYNLYSACMKRVYTDSILIFNYLDYNLKRTYIKFIMTLYIP